MGDTEFYKARLDSQTLSCDKLHNIRLNNSIGLISFQRNTRTKFRMTSHKHFNVSRKFYLNK